MTSKPSVAILGLGAMGLAFGKRISSLGYKTTVWNRTPGKGRAAGLDEAETAIAAASSADVVFIVVMDGKAVEAVATDEFLNALTPSTVLAIISTVSPDTVRALAKRSKKAPIIDTPWLGSPTHVVEGNGKFYVGAPNDIYEKLAPLFDHIGHKSTHCGDIGSGLVLKIASNFQLVIGVAALAESVAMARSNGIKDDVISESFSNSIVVSEASRIRLGSVLDAKHPGWFTPKLARKDVNLAISLAKESGLTTRLGPATDEMLIKVQDGDWEDFTAVLEAVQSK